MTLQKQDWMDERNRLTAVRRRIQQEIHRLEGTLQHRQSEVLHIRQNFWDEVTVNTSDYSEVAETAASITQQQSLLSEQERSFRHAEKTLAKLVKLEKSPYFARVDFAEMGMSEFEKIYIGIGSVVDEETHELLVFDWRAPISSIYYDFTPGPARYMTPEGIIEGEMSLKRQYMIKNGHLENMFDTGIQIGDEMLQIMLAKSAQEKMSSIVMTIQQEQNRIIRDDQHRILIVQGAAGSGKTSVALQRVAYLLYKYRNSLGSDNMVLFSPNSLFNDYVSNVLPELGEANLLQTTFQEHLDRVLGKNWIIEDAYDQLEYLLEGTAKEQEVSARIHGIEWKTSLAFMDVLNHYLEKLKSEGMLFRPFILRDKILISSEQLSQLFYDEFSVDSSIHRRIEKMKDWIYNQLKSLEERLFRNRFRKMLQSPKYLGSDGEMKAESRALAKKAFAPLFQMAKKLQFVNILGMYHQLFREWNRMENDAVDFPCHMEEIAQYTSDQLAKGNILYEDTTPFVYFQAWFKGWSYVNQIKQVVIDEAQDYSPFQLAYIRKQFPRARFTILGDLNQGIYHANVQSYRMMGQMFQEDDVDVIRMAKSYRSTSEIIEFTKRILLDPEPIEPIGRSGEYPWLEQVSKADQLPLAVAKGVHQLMEKGTESLAIICKTARETEQAYAALKDILNIEVHLITKDSFSFVSGVVVIPSYLAKGLEFDGVIVYNAGKEVYYQDSERKLLYTACTRALHHLYVYYLGELSPLLR